MAEYQRDEVTDSEHDDHKRPDQSLFYMIRVLSALTLLITTVVLIIRITFPIKWIYIGFVFILGCMILWTLCSFWLSNQKYPRIAQIILSISINSSLSLIPLFVLLVTLKLDGFINPHPVVLIIPLFIWQVFMLSFLIFIIPGLYNSQSDQKRYAWILLIYYFGLLLAEIATVILFSITYNLTWFIASGFVLFSLSFHLIIVVADCKLGSLWSIIVLGILINAVIIMTLYFDKGEWSKFQQYLMMIPLLVVTFIYTIQQLN